MYFSICYRQIHKSIILFIPLELSEDELTSSLKSSGKSDSSLDSSTKTGFLDTSKTSLDTSKTSLESSRPAAAAPLTTSLDRSGGGDRSAVGSESADELRMQTHILNSILDSEAIYLECLRWIIHICPAVLLEVSIPMNPYSRLLVCGLASRSVMLFYRAGNLHFQRNTC